MSKHSTRRASPWLLALGSGLLMSVVACPKPTPPKPDPKPESQPVDPQEAALRTECMGLNWAQRESIPEEQRARCRTLPNFEIQLDSCSVQSWIDLNAVPQAVKDFCLPLGYQAILDSCAARNWEESDNIPAEEISLCASYGYKPIIDVEICEKQDWTKPNFIRPYIKDQCLHIAFTPNCDPKKDPTCILPGDPAAKELFSHAAHGVDLPYQARERELTFKGKPISCADCHNSECKTDPKKKTLSVDVNRPGHDSCSGTRTGGCHPDFLRNQKVCKSCHTAPPKSPRNLLLRSYGGENTLGNIQYGFDFSHKSHIGENNVVARKGMEAKCENCHKLAKDGIRQGTAGHAECGQCHCESSSLAMNDCLACHRVDSAEQVKTGHAYLDWRPHAQQFAHKDHEINPTDGAKLDCQECHISVGDSVTLTEITVPPMLGCLQGCHDGAHKDQKSKPIFDGWVYCSKCHEAAELPKSTTARDKKKKK